MKRRLFCRSLVIGSLATAFPVQAQARPLRVAWASIERANSNSPYLGAFRDGMRELGYIEGRDLVIDAWWGDGAEAKLARQVDAIVRSRPDVIVAQGGLALSPLREAGLKIPIVFGVSAEPVEAGIAESFGHPGGNATGMSFFALDLVGKRMQIMKEALPAMKRLAVLADPQHPGQHKELAAAQAAADSLGLKINYFPVHSERELESALADIARDRYDAILAFADGFTQSYAGRIAAFSLQQRIPAVDGWSPFAREGNFMVYGPVLEDCYHRLAVYVDKIHKGARAADLPIELPTKVELVINLKTAKAIGVDVPAPLLVRADELIR
ncbi:MAG TPA: ABC transporter substrate-binding protein [Casimicrobiaceae bacterium]|nr:ABC transporter substrate-binding protein [Casimicrobiaceae bacterium]